METIEDISSVIEQQIAGIAATPRFPDGLYAPIEYILGDGGKRMRPLLTLLAAGIFRDDMKCALPSAVAVEVFHNFTLLHDDIMDNACQRRGRATVHVKWDENRAILSGDAMMILAYQILSDSDPKRLSELLTIFNKAALEVCEGQQLDMEFESRDFVSMDEYLEMIHLKTAVLMACSLQMGAVAAGADSEQCEALYRFGENLGLAFQIQDDMLDTYGDSATFGKRIGGDIAEGKQTFLKIAAYGVCDEDERDILRESRDYDTIRAIYDRHDVLGIAEDAINDYFYRALQSVDRMSVDTTRLRHYSNTLLRRNK